MIHLTYPGGSEVLVNPFHIFTIERAREGTRIVSSNGAAVVVAEDMERVDLAIKQWTKQQTS
jgi:uncharacterized protein YlzI (FlbEa/FlbD family)